MQHQTISGKILYVSHKPERMGEERGREDFTITRHTDGAVTIRALCELELGEAWRVSLEESLIQSLEAHFKAGNVEITY